ncbi:MAG: ABC transporter ATP-binding protein/permease [Synergistaceae bacterium]|jgi:ATP-binding cassette subfamily B protein|nr:ABC transporter ATP-binding protein/permease [Synergistaceae bacterium]
MFPVAAKSPFALLWNISAGSRALYCVSFSAMLASTFCGFLLPQAIRFVVDSVIGDVPPTSYFSGAFSGLTTGLAQAMSENRAFIVLLVTGISVAGELLGFIHRRTLSMAAESLTKRLRDALYTHIQHLPYAWHIDIQTGDIVQRCTSDVDVVHNFMSAQVVEVVRTLALIVFATSILLSMNVALSLLSFAFLVVTFLTSFFFLRRTAPHFQAADEAEGELLAAAQENFTGVRVVRAFGRELYETERFDLRNRRYAGLWVKLGNLLSLYWGLGDLLTGLQMVTICAAGAWQAVEGNVTVGEFIVFLTYNSMIIWPVRGLGRVLAEAGRTGVSLSRLLEILRARVEDDPPDALVTPIRGDIEFHRVNFSYGGAPVLRDLSFTIKQGTTLGILGATGSGKTTIAHLLCRLYDLKEGEGEIRIGGTDIRKYKRAWLRENIGIVLQEPFLYSRTIRENIASLRPDCPVEEIREAAAAAWLDEAIEHFSLGYDTLVGERGVTLSGGQKQRVAIARTLLKKPTIMIFDDSLSAVDTETDAKIRSGLHQRTKGVTTLIIAHRLTSVSGADRIMVLENGKIAEIGTPAELLKRNGFYRRIHDMQRNSEEELSEEMEFPHAVP